MTASQITRQIAVLNKTYAGGESTAAANTGFTFTLAGTDRFFNNTWHQDRQSATYRAQTRKGGANALNIWIVDFAYLGIATFPWDYASNPKIDGIRVQYSSLPGGSATNFNLGKTATHEAGHWLGLYHTFQGGCTTRNDEVSDTPAQSSPTSGCPVGRELLLAAGSRPDPQLHGLLLRLLLPHVHVRAERPDVPDVRRLPRLNAAGRWFRGDLGPPRNRSPARARVPDSRDAPHARPCVPGKFSGLPRKRS